MEKNNEVYSKSTVVVSDDEVWISCCDVMTGIGIGQFRDEGRILVGIAGLKNPIGARLHMKYEKRYYFELIPVRHANECPSFSRFLQVA